MAEVGGISFGQVAFPIAFGDRYVAVEPARLTGAPVVTIYRLDRTIDRLVVELFQGRPLPGAPPITVSPAGPSGAVRLGMQAGSDAVVGYLSGGDDLRSIVLAPDRIEVRDGDRIVFEISAVSISGFDVGVQLDDNGGVGIGASLPSDFPRKRLFQDATVVLTDLVKLPPVIANTDFQRCTLLGPAVVASVGPGNALTDCRFDADDADTHFIWELPATNGSIVGVIGLSECEITGCILKGVGFAVAPGTRKAAARQFFNQ